MTEDHPNATAQLITYIGLGGRTESVIADFDLGIGRFRPTHEYGIRRAIWDAAHGYVSGFRKRDIAYYLLTRSLSAHIWRATIRYEARHTDPRTCPHALYGIVGSGPICYDCGTTDAEALTPPGTSESTPSR